MSALPVFATKKHRKHKKYEDNFRRKENKNSKEGKARKFARESLLISVQQPI